MSKFGGLLGKRDRITQEDEESTAAATAERKVSSKSVKAKAAGRSADPSYQQATAYIPRHLHEEVMREIYKRQQFSELIEELLSDWLATRKSGNSKR